MYNKNLKNYNKAEFLFRSRWKRRLNEIKHFSKLSKRLKKEIKIFSKLKKKTFNLKLHFL
jgi:hypothetical protein